MRTHRAALAALGLAVACALVLLAAGPGTRWGWWHFRTGFLLMKVAAWGAVAAFVASGLAAWLARRARRRGLLLAGVAAAIAVLVFAVPLRLQRAARSVPPIHDVSTDVVDPPRFVAVLPLRADAPNTAEPADADVIAQQQAAYPEVVPLVTDVAPTRALDLAHEIALSMGWDVVALDETRGLLEATATTRWFGFRDDVVVRVRPAGAGSRIDVRSVSRVGRGDAGANAARVSDFLRRFRQRSR